MTSTAMVKGNRCLTKTTAAMLSEEEKMKSKKMGDNQRGKDEEANVN